MLQSFELLAARGWAVFELEARQDVLQLATQLGTPITTPNRSMVQLLPVKSKTVAAPNSYSSRFGFGRFPFHSDMANWTTPPRYVLLKMLSQRSAVPTLILPVSCPLQQVSLTELQHELWVGRARHRTFVCNLLAKRNGDDLFRWDLVSLKPLSNGAARVQVDFEQAINNSESIAIHLDYGEALVIDNWRVLHARPAVRKEDRSRILERVLVMERVYGK